ncbi:CBO0543 family protein [Bacillus litorisediminis]|uniref:CBO0543 family protein n=1 Tax=Bacillus litorisediminis TaxID=2922713 RepID=UPI001FAF51AA|nr:CBO0543 family protein [Bacillus litorisediminis]
MQIIYPIVFFLISLKWGKWNNLKQYYPTMLFMVIGNLLYGFLFKDYPMWRFEHTFEQELLPTRMSIEFLKSFTSFPILTFLFLSHYPEDQNRIKKVLYIVMWAFLFVLIEKISKWLGMISYHHGWNIWWSLFFDIVMFSILAIHYKRPIIAWILSGIMFLFLWHVFDIHFELLE